MDPKGIVRALRVQLGELGITVSHAQALELVAKTAGLKDWNTLAAKATASPEVPKPGSFFCPKCGNAHSVKNVGSAYVEQGPYDGKSYLYEGNAEHFECSACGNQFLDFQSEWVHYASDKYCVLLTGPQAGDGPKVFMFSVRDVLGIVTVKAGPRTCLRYADVVTEAGLADALHAEVTETGGNADLLELMLDTCESFDSGYGDTVAAAIQSLMTRRCPGGIESLINSPIPG